MGRPAADLTGLKFTRLVAIGRVALTKQGHRLLGTSGKHAVWLCRCECGVYVPVTAANLVAENQHSCGCLKSDELASRNRANPEWSRLGVKARARK